MTTEVARPNPEAVFRDLLTRQLRSIGAVLPKHLTPERMARLLMTETIRLPKLLECTPASIISGLITASQLGLEIGAGQGLAYLLPFSNHGRLEATLIIGYKGFAALALRSGQIKDFVAEVVYADEVDRGLFRASISPPSVTHTWAPKPRGVKREPTEIVAAYCMITTVTGGTHLVVLDADEIEERRKRGASGKGIKTPWDTDYERMARKSAVRSLLTGGTVPMSVEMASALEADETVGTVTIDVPSSAAPPRQIGQDLGGNAFDDLGRRMGVEPERVDRDPVPAELRDAATRQEAPAKKTTEKPTQELIDSVAAAESRLGGERMKRIRDTHGIRATVATSKLSIEQLQKLDAAYAAVEQELVEGDDDGEPGSRG